MEAEDAHPLPLHCVCVLTFFRVRDAPPAQSNNRNRDLSGYERNNLVAPVSAQPRFNRNIHLFQKITTGNVSMLKFTRNLNDSVLCSN